MPEVLKEIGRNHIMLRSGDFISCTADGVRYDTIEIRSIEAPFIILKGRNGDIKIHQHKLKLILKSGPPITNTRNAIDVIPYIVFPVTNPDIDLYKYHGNLYYSSAKNTTIQITTEGPSIFNVTQFDNGKFEILVDPLNQPNPATPPTIRLPGPTNVELLVELSKHPDNFGTQVAFY